MTPPRRKSNHHLPARVYFKHNAYYYVDRKNKWHKLGTSFSQAMREYADITSGIFNSNTLNGIFDRYILEVAPQKSKTTYQRELYALKFLKTAFGNLFPHELSPVLIYKYMDVRVKTVAPQTVNKEKSILMSVCHAAIRWGIMTSNPCTEVKPLKVKPKSPIRYVTDEEFKKVYDSASPAIKIAMRLAYATALRMGDLLSLRFSDCTRDGLLVMINKTQKPILFAWTPEIKSIIESAKPTTGILRSLYIIANKKGQPYTRDGFKTLWRRALKKAVKQQKLEYVFKFHDIRRKAATDAEKLKGREYARQLLGHQSQTMTARYIGGTPLIEGLEKRILLDK